MKEIRFKPNSGVKNPLNEKGLTILRTLNFILEQQQSEENLKIKVPEEIFSSDIQKELSKGFISDCQFYRYLRSLKKNELISINKDRWKRLRGGGYPITIMQSGINILKILNEYYNNNFNIE